MAWVVPCTALHALRACDGLCGCRGLFNGETLGSRVAKMRARSLCDSTSLDCRECLELLFLALIAFIVFWLLAAVHRSLVAIDTGWRVLQCRCSIPRILCDAAHKTEGAVAMLDASLRCVYFGAHVSRIISFFAIFRVSQSFAGGCAHGWWNSAALAAKYPPHQRKAVRVRAGAGKGARFAAFALVFEG